MREKCLLSLDLEFMKNTTYLFASFFPAHRPHGWFIDNNNNKKKNLTHFFTQSPGYAHEAKKIKHHTRLNCMYIIYIIYIYIHTHAI